MFVTKVTAFAILGSMAAATYVPGNKKHDGSVQIHPDCDFNKCVTLKYHEYRDYDNDYERNKGKKHYRDLAARDGGSYGGSGSYGGEHKNKYDGKKEEKYDGKKHDKCGKEKCDDDDDDDEYKKKKHHKTYEVVIEECNGSEYQDWFVRDSFVKSAATDCEDYCLTAEDRKGYFFNGGKIFAEKCDKHDLAQNWCYDERHHTFEIKDTNFCLDLPNGKAFDGACLQTWECIKDNKNQVWKLTK